MAWVPPLVCATEKKICTTVTEPGLAVQPLAEWKTAVGCIGFDVSKLRMTSPGWDAPDVTYRRSKISRLPTVQTGPLLNILGFRNR